ncbi:MAG TPA: transcriptional regulator [Eubacterium sp.]|jgi:excisionase family DNA binding protein|nr:transcriptional regulator [Eubacterium sp.]HCO36722.1 transcriptional regulator [Eubacterium sp.]
MNDIERWYSLEEISNHLGVSKDTIRAWIRKETIPFYKVGRQYKFKVSEVDAWVESGQSAEADKNNTVEEKQDGSGK